MGKIIMITGAAGFIGRHCVKCARERGHTVIAVVRSEVGVLANWQSDPMIEVIVSDLAKDANPQLADAAKRAETIIHVAASLAGDDAQQARDTVLATKTLLRTMEAMPRQNRKLILVSSIAVYDTAGLQENAVLDESTPIETNLDKRDTYCRNKILQETAALQAAGSNKLDLFIMRPGAVFGPGRLWNAHLGHALGPILLRMGSKGQVPVSHVTHCAKALVLAAETPLSGVEIINVLDDDLPDRKTYIQVLRTTGWPRIVIPMSWRLLVGLGNICVRIPNMPGLLRPAIIKSRMMPLRYSNTKLKKQLGWQADIPFEKAMKRAILAENRGAL